MVDNLIARHRRTKVVKATARLSDRFRHAYSNVDYDVARNGERFVLSRLAEFQPQCVFDVGANIGRWATMAHSLLGGADIHCFEVMPATAAHLQERLDGRPRMVINNFGLGERAEEVTLKYFPGHDSFTTVTDYPREIEALSATGQVVRGDTYAAEHGIAHIDLLKIDVEGAEPDVLRGCAGLIAEGRVDAIQFEYGTVNILTHFLLHDFYQLLSEYDIGKIYPSYVDFKPYDFGDEDFLGPNYLAVRRDREDLKAAFA